MNPDYANQLSSLVDNYSSVASELLDLLEIEQQALAQRQFDEAHAQQSSRAEGHAVCRAQAHNPGHRQQPAQGDP